MSVKIVCIGDSLTAGFGVEAKARWTDLLSNDLQIEIINSGISGDTTSGMLARFYEMVIKHNPSHVIILGGTNDLWLNLQNNIIIGNILAMTRYAKHHEIVPIIGIPTPFYNLGEYTDDSPFIETPELSERIKSYQKIVKQFALDDTLSFIDFSLNMEPKLFLEDGLHPNKEGHKKMSDIAKLSLEHLIIKQ